MSRIYLAMGEGCGMKEKREDSGREGKGGEKRGEKRKGGEGKKGEGRGRVEKQSAEQTAYVKILRWKHLDTLQEMESRPARLEDRRRVR